MKLPNSIKLSLVKQKQLAGSSVIQWTRFVRIVGNHRMPIILTGNYISTRCYNIHLYQRMKIWRRYVCTGTCLAMNWPAIYVPLFPELLPVTSKRLVSVKLPNMVRTLSTAIRSYSAQLMNYSEFLFVKNA